MKKKSVTLMAAAVLAMPFAVSAKSTVQIYGKARVAYLHADSGAGINSGDMLFNPGGSKIGFKGTEDLGGGNAAWFQLEETFPLDGEDASWTSRNTGIGLKGHWGLFGAGQWDTPYKQIGGGSDMWQGIGDTGIGGVDAIISNRDTTAGNGTHVPYTFARRHKGLLWYDSPDFGGFRFSAAFSDNRGDDAVGGVNTPDSATGNPRLYSLNASYGNGPLAIGFGYEKHKDFVRSGSNDDAWTLSGAYKFAQVFRIGLNYEHLKYSDDVAAGSGDTQRNSWAVFADWHVSGPHSLHAAYVKANSTSGSQVATLGSVVGNAGAGGTDANLWALQYGYAFSKRTSVALTYARLNNDNSANYFQYGAVSNPGQDQTVYGLTMSHVF
ncbi:MAG TPA: porin [Burkholderiales bacterium]|jgi:predicted porin|nr:porin [Burkholderiales bacterium]